MLNGTTLTVLITNYATNEPESYTEMAAVLEGLMDKTSVGARQPLTKALKTYYGTQHPINFKNSSAGYYDNYNTISGCIDEILDIVFKDKLIYQINTLGGAINSAELASKSCYPHRQYNYLCELQSYWKNDDAKSRKLKAFDAVQNILDQHGISAQYRNYPNLAFKSWETAYYGEENYKQLQTIKAELDPNDVVQNPQSIKLAAFN